MHEWESRVRLLTWPLVENECVGVELEMVRYHIHLRYALWQLLFMYSSRKIVSKFRFACFAQPAHIRNELDWLAISVHTQISNMAGYSLHLCVLESSQQWARTHLRAYYIIINITITGSTRHSNRSVCLSVSIHNNTYFMYNVHV